MKKSEKRLLIVFGIALFLVANVIAEGIFARRKAAARAAIDTHTSSIEEFEFLLQNRATLDQQRSWLTAKQPRFISEESAATDVENHIKRCADVAGVTIDSSKQSTPIETPNYMQIGLQTNVSGDAAGVTQFVSLVQSQDGFYAIPSVKFTPDRRDPSILRLTATIARLYSTGTSTPTGPSTADSVAANNGN